MILHQTLKKERRKAVSRKRKGNRVIYEVTSDWEATKAEEFERRFRPHITEDELKRIVPDGWIKGTKRRLKTFGGDNGHTD